LKYQKQYHKDKRNNDPGFKLLTNLRIEIYHALQNNQKSGHTTDLLGCSIEFFKQYLESQFQPGMSWDNQGKWHIDHIIPCSSFNLLVPDQQRLCFNYHNLQPLWARDNMSKSNKIIV